jgi:hypothetical protein
MISILYIYTYKIGRPCLTDSLVYGSLTDEQRENLQALLDPTAKFFEVIFNRVYTKQGRKRRGRDKNWNFHCSLL